jgi:hypothetical protein
MSGYKGKRLITFGCSYTGYVTATWADYMGANFEEYMNYGEGGASNTFIKNRFIEVNSNLNLNEDDYVVVMFTNMDRFSYRNHTKWYHGGNIYFNDSISKEFLNDMWSPKWSVYESYIAFKTIKEILTLKNIKHTILTSMNNNHMVEEFKNSILISNYLKYMNDVLDVKEAMDDWKCRKYPNEIEYTKYDDRDEYDTHPTQEMHYEYLKEIFPEYDTIQSKQRYELSLKAVDTKSIQSQFEIYAKYILTPLNRAYWQGPKIFF